MKKVLAALKARYWDGRTASERKTLRMGGAIIAPLLTWALLWQPAHDARSKLEAELPRLRTQAEDMLLLANQAQTLRQRPRLAVLDSEALKGVVERAARESGLALTVVAGEKNSVRISADRLAFAQWLPWLQSLSAKQHIRLSSAMIAATAEPGMVRLQATLTNGADE